MKKKKFWLVSEVFYPDTVPTAHIMTAIAEQLVSKKEVHVICGPAGYEKSFVTNEEALDANIVIHRVNIPQLDKNRPVNRIIRQLILTVKMAFKCLRKIGRDDSVLLVTNPALLVLLIGLIKALKKFDLTILVHDVFPENMVPAKFITKGSFKFKVLKRIFDNAFAKADRLFVLGEDMKELMLQKICRRSTPPNFPWRNRTF